MALLPWSRRSSGSAARNERVFRAGMRRLTREIDAIIARGASAGHLKSGATIKAFVQAMNATTTEAVNEALNGIAAVTEHAGRKRQRLLEELCRSLEAHQRTAEGVIKIAIERIGLGDAFKHAEPLIEQSRRRVGEQIADFAEGWTAPAGKAWKERHQILYDGLLLLIGAAIGIAGQALADRFIRPSETAIVSLWRAVAPDVALATAAVPDRRKIAAKSLKKWWTH